jgi:hypothetical protein
MEDCPEEKAAKTRAEAPEKRAKDFKLEWLRLTAEADESDDELQQDFSDPAAATALETFRTRWKELEVLDHPLSRSFGGQAITLLLSHPGFRDSVQELAAEWRIGPPGE